MGSMKEKRNGGGRDRGPALLELVLQYFSLAVLCVVCALASFYITDMVKANGVKSRILSGTGEATVEAAHVSPVDDPVTEPEPLAEVMESEDDAASQLFAPKPFPTAAAAQLFHAPLDSLPIQHVAAPPSPSSNPLGVDATTDGDFPADRVPTRYITAETVAKDTVLLTVDPSRHCVSKETLDATFAPVDVQSRVEGDLKWVLNKYLLQYDDSEVGDVSMTEEFHDALVALQLIAMEARTGAKPAWATLLATVARPPSLHDYPKASIKGFFPPAVGYTYDYIDHRVNTTFAALHALNVYLELPEGMAFNVTREAVAEAMRLVLSRAQTMPAPTVRGLCAPLVPLQHNPTSPNTRLEARGTKLALITTEKLPPGTILTLNINPYLAAQKSLLQHGDYDEATPFVGVDIDLDPSDYAVQEGCLLHELVVHRTGHPHRRTIQCLLLQLLPKSQKHTYVETLLGPDLHKRQELWEYFERWVDALITSNYSYPVVPGADDTKTASGDTITDAPPITERVKPLSHPDAYLGRVARMVRRVQEVLRRALEHVRKEVEFLRKEIHHFREQSVELRIEVEKQMSPLERVWMHEGVKSRSLTSDDSWWYNPEEDESLARDDVPKLTAGDGDM